MRRTRATDSVQVGNGRVERIVAADQDDELLRLAGSHHNPLLIDNPDDALRVMDLLLDYTQDHTN
ncbi:hypothetical protein HSEST_3105 (plasmid) [Halapricum desulfuricans]|uniref:Uncharacterized protein n=1 Tax=Halapricum desulfuricans TaxID=2841257 RepID=A0A897P0M0_9EURY|nr:hypothetical protein HSEST_3105 [Halapricum desulfuricans]